MPRFAIQELSQFYPKMEPRRIRFGRVNEERPTLSSARWYTIPGALILGLGLASLVASLLLWRRDHRLESMSPYKTATSKQLSSRLGASSQPSSQNGDSELKQTGFGHELQATGKVLGWFFFPLVIGNVVVARLMQVGMIDEDLGMQILMVTLPIFFVTSIAFLAIYGLTSPMLKLHRANRAELPRRVIRDFDNWVRDFELLGVQFLGYADCYFMGKQWHAYMLSPDQTTVVSLSHQQGKLTVAIQAIFNDGVDCEVGRASAPLVVEAFGIGVPLCTCYQIKGTAPELLELFRHYVNSFAASGSQPLRVRPADIFHLYHYQAIVAGWWAYKSSMRFTRPEPLPRPSEIIQQGENGLEFCFRRSAELDNAFARVGCSSQGQQGQGAPVLVS